MDRHEIDRVFLKRRRIPYAFRADLNRVSKRQISYGLNFQPLYDELADFGNRDDLKVLERNLNRKFRYKKIRHYQESRG